MELIPAGPKQEPNRPLPTSGRASFGQTLSSQYSRILGPAANQLSFYTSNDYDPDVQARAEEYIKDAGLLEMTRITFAGLASAPTTT